MPAQQAHAQADQLHYVPPFFARQDLNEHYALVSTLETTPFDVVMKDGAGNVIHTFSNLVNSSPQVHNFTGTNYDQTGVLDGDELNLVSDEGLVFTGSGAFTVNIRHSSTLQGMSLTSKGTFGLGTDFRSGHMITRDSATNAKAHVISVMATQDNTTVNFGDIEATVDFHGGASNPFLTSKVLQAGESFVIAYWISENASEDHNLVNGVHVTSDKPIAMNSGSWLGGNQGTGKDIGMDQIVPIDRIGSDYALVVGDATSHADALERPGVVAAFDDTDVFVGGVFHSTLASAGDYVYLTFPETVPGTPDPNLYVTTSKAAYLYQSTSANDLDGNGLSFIPPLRCNGTAEVVIADADLLGASALAVIARAGATVKVNNVTLTSPDAIPGTTDWVSYRATAGIVDTVLVESTRTMNVSLVTASGNRGAAGFFSGFQDTPAVSISGTNDLCLMSPLLLSVDSTEGFASFQWSLDGTPIPGATASTYSASVAGNYTVIGVLIDDGSTACSGGSTTASPAIELIDIDCVCGDGTVGPGEECDDGNDIDTDFCTNACTDAVCGDTIVGPGEECDDGNNVDTDSCTNACTNAVCGDGITGPGEECDDGNTVDTDACTNACTSAVCGDGVTAGGEECDDAGMTAGDGCSDTCEVEDGFECTGEPSVCVESDPGIQQLAPGSWPDIDAPGKVVTFVSPADLNIDSRVPADNTDGSEEVFLLNLKAKTKVEQGICIGGSNHAMPCDSRKDCSGSPPFKFSQCGRFSQLTDTLAGGTAFEHPRVSRKAKILAYNDLTGAATDVFTFTRKTFEKVALAAALDNLGEGSHPSVNSTGKYLCVESTADLTGDNPDGNSEIFVYEVKRTRWLQITDTVAPVQNHNPEMAYHREIIFDSNGDIGQENRSNLDNADLSRELFRAKIGRRRSSLLQLTELVGADVTNECATFAGAWAYFSSQGDLHTDSGPAVSNADGNTELFRWRRAGVAEGLIQQVTDTTTGESIGADCLPRGSLITFESTANLDATGATNRRVWLVNSRTGELTLLSRSEIGDSQRSRISRQMVIFQSNSDLVHKNAAGDEVLYLYDIKGKDQGVTGGP